MLHTNSEKGVSLLFIALISSLILAVGLGISSLLVQQIGMMGEIGYSVVAFYAADNGIEEALYSLYQSPAPIPNHSGELDGAYYDAQAQCCNPDLEGCSLALAEDCPLGADQVNSDCDALNYCLKSLGGYKKTKRAIEIKY